MESIVKLQQHGVTNAKMNTYGTYGVLCVVVVVVKLDAGSEIKVVELGKIV